LQDNLKSKFEVKIEFKKLKHLKLEKADKGDDTWHFKLPA